ncbi:hypothetical protein TCDM_11225 [Trypanosoma cruzi Dm28c]|uniref:Uncharacterized protein n=1 Tax=Trypanosoma cruzi Dm28c TaxID=1416333 RepID=V5B5E4_TRYCR|nr:hypothetical protein TCDM_11225 [Trypanosoma cruzi Dm28c]
MSVCAGACTLEPFGAACFLCFYCFLLLFFSLLLFCHYLFFVCFSCCLHTSGRSEFFSFVNGLFSLIFFCFFF